MRTRPNLAQYEISAALRRRLNIATIVAVALLSLLVGRLWYLQILHGDTMRMLSENNRVRLRRVQATRGSIVDRHGRVLVDSRPSFDAVLVPEDARDLHATVETAAQFLGQSAAETEALIKEARGRPAFQEIVIKRDLDWQEVVALESRQRDLPGVSIRITPRRSYPHGESLAHVLGYVGEVSQEDLERDRRYRPGDVVGKAGLEKVFEDRLRGINGGQQFEVDALGRELRVLREVEEVPGSRLSLTVDLDLQLAAEQALGDRVGAIVALDPRNGETLALVSKPSYDPNLFIHGIRSSDWKALTNHPRKPLTNRAIQGQYPPGSTFKMIVAAAALEEGVVNPFTGITCGGGVTFGGHYFRCWRKGGHGNVDVHRALVMSCDTFFYLVGPRVGMDTIAKYARHFGLGAATGIGLEHERAGTVPDSAWKRKRFGKQWYAGETLSASIGQGYVTATPLQMATAVATLATGRRYRPQLVSKITEPDGQSFESFPPIEAERLPLRDSTLNQVREGLIGVVNEGNGTGRRARLKDITVAGKTGTSQVVAIGARRLKAEELPWNHRDHAWFVAYAPAEDPVVAVAAMVEHADGGGGAVAAPIVHDVLEAYFKLQGQSGPTRYAYVQD